MPNIRSNPDGYLRQGHLNAKPGFWDAMDFEYRLCTHGQRMAYEDAANKSTGAKKSAVMCEAIARHIKSWSECDDKGNPIQVNKETVGLVENSFLVDRLYNIVVGWELPDDKEPTVGESGTTEAATLIDSLLESVPPGVLVSERAEKN